MQIPNTKNPNNNVLFVCLGNICRSPAAEGIMKKLVADHELEDTVFVDSPAHRAGTRANCPTTVCVCTDNAADTISLRVRENLFTAILTNSITLW